jgi:hypothetical protein
MIPITNYNSSSSDEFDDWELVESSFDEILHSKEAFLEEGTFSKYELLDFTRPHAEGYSRHFSSFNGAYPYQIDGVAMNTEAVFKHFSSRLPGRINEKSPIEFFQSLIRRDHGRALQDRALQVSAFLKLIGDNNAVFSDAAFEKLMPLGVITNSTSVKHGRIDPIIMNIGRRMIGFEVLGEEVTFESKGTYLTSRRVLVSIPDFDGNVKYTIVRSFSPVLE